MAASHLNNQHGFSLAEVIIAVAVNLVILGLVSSLFIKQLRTYGAQDDIVRMQQSARLAMETMTRDIRMAGYNHRQAGPAFSPFTTATSNAITFKRYSGNGFIRTTYDLDSKKNLRRTVNFSVKQVFGNISSLGFDYLDTASAPATTSGSIRQVVITLITKTARPDKDYSINGGYRSYRLENTVTPRNFID